MKAVFATGWRWERVRATMTLSLARHRLFSACLTVLLSLLVLEGCVGKARVSEIQYQRALDLVDQGVVNLEQRRFQQAEASFSLAYELAPLAAALDGQGCVALLQGEWQRAEDFFRRAYMMDEGYDEAAAHLALLLDARGDTTQARELYRWYLTRHPEDAAVRNNMAALEFDQGGDKRLILQELMRAAAVSRHGVIRDNITIVERQ